MIYTNNFELPKFSGTDKVKMSPFNDFFLKIANGLYDIASSVTSSIQLIADLTEKGNKLSQQIEASNRVIINEQAKANATDIIIDDVKILNTAHTQDIDDLNTSNYVNISSVNALNSAYNEYIKFRFGIVENQYGYYKGTEFIAF